jgi:hypothetical protein
MEMNLTRDGFTKNALKTMALCLCLLALRSLPSLTNRFHSLRAVQQLVWELRNGDLNAADFHALSAGYYEKLEQARTPAWADKNGFRFRDDFLRYEYKPNVSFPYAAGMRVTNSFGMANPEYGYEKPPFTRRIAWIGDSMSVGPYGHSYEQLLENRLNQSYLTPDIHQFQVLNFSVPGYFSVQMMDVVLEKVPKFHPDVYVVTLTSLEMGGLGGPPRHLAMLNESGIDFKYDYLRQIAAKAGVKRTDRRAEVMSKLKPYSLQITRWAFEQIHKSAEAHGAKMIVVMVSGPTNLYVTGSDFDQLHKAVDGLGVPVIDLRGTFQNIDDLAALQVAQGEDIHPNVRGHQMIFDDLYAHLLAQPDALSALTGSVPGHQ